MAQVTNQVFYATSYHPIQAGSIDGTDTAAHDNAIYRALLASSTGLYDPTGDQKAVGDPHCTLFVGRLARHTTEETLNQAMSKFGKVKHIRLVRHIVTGASQGYAFVEFESDKEMLYAYEMAHYNIIDGSQILVDYNRQQLMSGWIPRRLGGGLGGHKESGQLRFGGRDRPFRAPLRPIPDEQLVKLGIPLPPVGRYMSRFLLPPVPRRPDRSKETPHRRRSSQRENRRGTPKYEIPGGDDKRYVERLSSRSPVRPSKLVEEREDAVKSSSSSRHRKGKHSLDDEGDASAHTRRVRRHAGEESHKAHKDYIPEAGHEDEYYKQRYSYPEIPNARYDGSTEYERCSPVYDSRSKPEHGHESKEGRRSRSNDPDIRSPEHERCTSKHRQERRERIKSRHDKSRDSTDKETKSTNQRRKKEV
ncbi:hypothetical protein Mapa_011939 [Marchantia paleacea]|nr:hypothetical protein Mapa_011939 [Marchantia paleacea]